MKSTHPLKCNQADAIISATTDLCNCHGKWCRWDWQRSGPAVPCGGRSPPPRIRSS